MGRMTFDDMPVKMDDTYRVIYSSYATVDKQWFMLDIDRHVACDSEELSQGCIPARLSCNDEGSQKRQKSTHNT